MDRISRQTSNDKELAEQLLAWITYAQRPLSLKELQHALATSPGMTDMDHESIVPEQLLTSVCAGLIIIDGNRSIVRLVRKWLITGHDIISPFKSSLADYTAQVYFEKNGQTLFPNAEAYISRTCLTYLSFNVFQEHDSKDMALLEYAAVHWGDHARRATEDSSAWVQEFLSRKSNCAIQALLPYLGHTNGEPALTGFGQIHLVSFFGLENIVRHLLKNNHSADPKDSRGRTPLFFAVRNGHLEVVRLLLARDDVDVNSQSPLSCAAAYGHLEVIRLLLARDDVDINKTDRCGRSPLSYAAADENLEMVRLLLA
jgi:hypothetical protein